MAPDQVLAIANIATAIASVLAAIAAFLAVCIAYKAFRSQERAFYASSEAFRLSLSADLVTKLEEKFDSDVMRHARLSAATALLGQESIGEAEDAFDFFEMLGLLSRVGALNNEMVHCIFFHWTNMYWTAGQDYIAQTRNNRSSTLWTDFQTIYEKTLELEAQKDARSKDLKLSKQDLEQYLRDEIEECQR